MNKMMVYEYGTQSTHIRILCRDSHKMIARIYQMNKTK